MEERFETRTNGLVQYMDMDMCTRMDMDKVMDMDKDVDMDMDMDIDMHAHAVAHALPPRLSCHLPAHPPWFHALLSPSILLLASAISLIA